MRSTPPAAIMPQCDANSIDVVFSDPPTPTSGDHWMPSIVGTWKLAHATARDTAGAARPSPYGGKALGRVTFTAGGRMMSVVCDGRKELPAGVSREYSSYAAATPMTARSLSPGLTRPQTRAASAAIRCAGSALRAPA